MLPGGQQVEVAAPSDGSPLGSSNDRYWHKADIGLDRAEVRK